jgi:glutamate--cysteine ligase
MNPNPILTSVADVELFIAESVWPEANRPDRFGAEAEAFPIVVENGLPQGRLRLREGSPSVVSILDGAAAGQSEVLRRSTDKLAYPTRRGGWITFEPGAQIEHSTSPAATVIEVVGELDAVWEGLRTTFWEDDVCLLSLGVDPWNETRNIPQQLEEERYKAMAVHLGSRGPAGAEMMLNTSALQVNLDAGTGSNRQERWLAANLISPIVTAMFATSPGDGYRTLRAKAWQGLDPTRTGFPDWGSVEDADPMRDIVSRALRADVMYVRRDDGATPGRRGWSFGEWVRDGHPTIGHPTRADLDTHLSTLFTEIRPRDGTLEFRGIDGMPQRWWHVPLLIVGALLYEPNARSQVIDELASNASRLDHLWRLAASEGLTNPELQRMARRVGEISLVAAKRDSGRFGHELTRSAETFLENFTFQGRSPGDDFLPLLKDPRKALTWANPDHAMRGAA